MNKNLFDQIVAALQPEMGDAKARKAMIEAALYGCPVLQKVDWDGAAQVFTIRLVQLLEQFGEIASGKPAIAALIEGIRQQVGIDKQKILDDLLSRLIQHSGIPTKQILDLPIQSIATPPEERRPTVFISYSRTDEAFARQLIADLGVAGHTCWIDTAAIKGGEEWLASIAEGIMNSYALVVVVTIRALESQWVRDEILWARQNGKPIIPLLLESVANDPRYFPLIGYQKISVVEHAYAGALPKLLESLAPLKPASTLPDRLSPQRNRELSFLKRLLLEEVVDTEKYTPMGGASHRQRVEMQAVFEHRPFQLMSFGKKEPETRRFDNTVEEILHIRRAVLLGEPGGGKTTTIWKLAAELAAAAMHDPKASIPLLVRLGRWTDNDQSLVDFITSQSGELGPHLDSLLAEKRAALLLDGLNELPAGQRDVKYPQVQKLIEDHPQILAIVSCRELDYTVDLKFDRINITPLDPIRIRDFAVRYLEEEKGEALFWKLAGHEAKSRYTQFIQQFGPQLSDPDRVFWLEARLADGIFWGWWEEDNRKWEEWVRLREAPSSLMVLARNPYMLLMLASVFAEQNELPENRGELFKLFVQTLLSREKILEDEQQALTRGLEAVAFEMQTRRSNDEQGDALTVLPKAEALAFLNERMLYLAGSASILDISQQVRFTHQLLQEYFAARCLDVKIRTDAAPFKATDIWLSEHWWKRTNWEEGAILLAGLYSNDCTPVVEWVAKANPEVAAQSVVRSGAALADATRERLRREWIHRLTDLQHDPEPHSRAAVGRALGLTGWDNRPGVGVSVMGGLHLPDIDWVEIPAGKFQYGEKKRKLTLPTFHLSRYPVTYAQFQTFLDDPKGIADPRWLEGLAGGEKERQTSEQAFKFANHPRETVSWYQAIAFCRWLSWRFGGGFALNKIEEWAVRLPTEFEWEKAARGTDGRIYPYEGEFNAAKGNTSKTGLRQTSAVGIFPNGASPYGVIDMSGNVWEWCLSDRNKPAPDARSEKLDTENNRVLRGGSWLDFLMIVPAVVRSFNLPAVRNDRFGFRLSCVVRPCVQ